MTYLEVAKKDVLLTVANWAADFLDHFWGKFVAWGYIALFWEQIFTALFGFRRVVILFGSVFCFVRF